MAKKKMGKVIPFPKRPKAPAKEPLESGMRTLDKTGCIALLETVAPVPTRLRSALNLPDRLYVVDKGPSISSDPENGIRDIAARLVRGEELAPDLFDGAPDYAIHLTYRGSSSFCVLLDKSRKILVMESLGNALGGGVTWDYMAGAIDDALKSRDDHAKRGEGFSFVLSQESLISVL